MPFKGERSHPLEGVKGAKKRLPKLPRAPEEVDLQEQSSIYLQERNQMMRLKRMREEMLLAKERDLSDRQRGVEVSVNVAGRAFPGTAPGKLGLLPAFSPNIAPIQLLFYTCTVQACGGRSMRALQPSTANHLTFRIALSTRDMHLNASRR